MYLLFGILLTFTAVFLILLVLVQRGRGGGLAGALGGMGGQSAFGSKAGDLFTRLTMGTAVVWVLLCVASIYLLGGASDKLSGELGTGATGAEDSVVTEPLEDPAAVPPAAPAAPDGSELPASGA